MSQDTSLPARAERVATAAHASIGQVRKYTGEPYPVHLAGVARRVGETPGCSEAMIAAAWLHDVLEDVPSVTLDQLQLTFGPEVASLVLQLTDVSRPGDGNRAVRKAKDRDHLSQASPEAQTVKLADLPERNAILRFLNPPAFPTRCPPPGRTEAAMTLAAPYPRAEDRALLGTLVEALREGATEAPPWYLSHGQRWRWLVETLMGHPLIRGGQRPRDFPADPGGRRAVASAVEFQSRRVASWGQLPGELGGPFGEWLYAFVLLVEDLLRKAPAKAEGDGPEAPATREAVALEALLWLIWQTLRAAGLHQDEGSCHKLLAGIGMSIQDAGGLTAAYNPKSPWGDACRLRAVAQVGLAAEAALSAATAPRAKPLRHHREPVRALLKTRIWILTVKGFEIQKYIARTQTFWLARGASAWASQCLAEVRETLLELSEEGVIPTHLHLVTDVDAVVRFACLTEPDCGLIQAALEERIGLAWSRGDERFARKHPRLASFLDSLPAGLTGDLDPRCCLPHLCLERSAPRTLRQFCCRTRSKTEEERDEEKRARAQDGTRRIVRFPRQVPGAPACS